MLVSENVVRAIMMFSLVFGSTAVSALNAEDDCIGEFVRFVESSTGLFSTNALAFKENVCSRRDEILSGIDYNPRIVSILGLAELQILKRMADDVTGWNIAQMKVFTEMSLESLSAAGSDVDAKQAIFCFADIRRSIKSRIISGYEFSRNINPPSQDGTAIAEFSKKKRKDREQRALMDVDEDFGLALAVNARRYVANLHDASERDDFVGKLSDRCLLLDREMTAILTGDFGNLRK